MTTSVITVDRITPYQEIDRLLTQHRISGVPVLMMGRVAGVIPKRTCWPRRTSGPGRPGWPRRPASAGGSASGHRWG